MIPDQYIVNEKETKSFKLCEFKNKYKLVCMSKITYESVNLNYNFILRDHTVILVHKKTLRFIFIIESVLNLLHAIQIVFTLKINLIQN